MPVVLHSTGSAGPNQNPTITLTSVPANETILLFVAGPVTLAIGAGSTTGWIRDYYEVNLSGGAVFRLPAASNLGGTVTLIVATNGPRYIAYVAVTGNIDTPQYGDFNQGGQNGGSLGTGQHLFAEQSHVFAFFSLSAILETDLDIASYDRSFVELGDSGITPPDTNEESRLWVAYKADTAMANDGVNATLVNGLSGSGQKGMVAYSATAEEVGTEEGLYDSLSLTPGAPVTDAQGLNLYTKFFVGNPVTVKALRYFRPTGATGTYALTLWTAVEAMPLYTTTDSSGAPNTWVDVPINDTVLQPGWYIVGEFVPAGQPYVAFAGGHPDSPNTVSPSKSLWTMSGAVSTPLDARPATYNYGSSPTYIDYGSLESFDVPDQHNAYGVQPVVVPLSSWNPPIFWDAPPAGQFSEGGSITLGHKFNPVYTSTITGVLFWRGMTEVTAESPIVMLYDHLGTNLRYKEFSPAQSAYGWNRIDFDTPLVVTSGNEYMVAFYSPNGFYAASPGILPSLVDGPSHDLLASGGKYTTRGVPAYPDDDAGNFSYYYVEPVFLSSGNIPSVDAGADQNAVVGDTVTLTADIQDDGTIVSRLWSQLSGPSLAPTSPTAISTAVGPFTQAGTYVYRMAATDDEALTGEDTVVVTVIDPGAPTTYRVWAVTDVPNPAHFFPNQGTLNLGLSFTVQEANQLLYRFWAYYRPEMGTLNWTLYDDAAGLQLATATLAASGTTGWRSVEVDGGPFALSNGVSYIAAFKESPDSGSFYATINYYPTGRTTTYDVGPFRLGNASQDVGVSPNVYNTNAIVSEPSDSATAGRNYWIDVEIGAVVPGVVQAQAGADQTRITGDVVTLDGSTSVGDNLSYDWQQTAGATVTLQGSGATRTFTAPADGPLTFELTVTDTVLLESDADTVTINIAGNETAAENTLTGNPSAEWFGFTGVGFRSVLGYAYPFNPNVGTTVEFRVDGNADELKIYRLGWYGGLGARLIETLAVTPVDQPDPENIPDLAGGSTCYEAANWTTNATWAIPADATSGVYLGICRNTSTGHTSFLRFVVTDHARTADIVLTTADATWQAYNFYGPGSTDGGCVYGPSRNFDAGARAFGWSYRRPIVHREARVNDLFNSEVAFIRFFERNGYDIKYISHVDLDAGNGLSNAKIFVSSGHDEYWSEPSRDVVQAHVASGKHAIFASGNEVFWRTERHASNPDWFYCRKDTMPGPGAHVAGTLLGPTWTGTWRDTRWVGRRPENLQTGTTFRMNGIFDRTFSVTAATYGASPFWRDTSVAQGTNLSVSGIVGFEADEYAPPADATAVRLSATLLDISGSRADDNGETYGGSGNMDHGLVLFQRLDEGVTFGLGTCQWSWGLDDFHDRGTAVANPAMKQATINILSDMGAQPSYVESGLVMPTPVAWSAYGLSSPSVTGIYDAAGNQLQPKLKKSDGSVVDISFLIKD